MTRPGLSSGRSTRYNTGDPTISDLLSQFDRRLKALESGGGKGNTSIDSGELTLKSGATLIVRRDLDDGVVARIGNIDGNVWGMQANNPNTGGDGTPMFVAGASEPGGFDEGGVVNVIDHQGVVVVSLGDNWGLGGPGFDYPFAPTSVHATPSASTTSGTFAGLWTVYGYAAHPFLTLSYLIQNDAATTSEVRARDTYFSDPTTTPISYGASAFQYDSITLEHINDVSGGPPSSGFLFKIDLEMRRVSGGGACRLQLLSVNGVG
jgi:hypothetical protein